MIMQAFGIFVLKVLPTYLIVQCLASVAPIKRTMGFPCVAFVRLLKAYLTA